jgi:hypothetical protein
VHKTCSNCAYFIDTLVREGVGECGVHFCCAGYLPVEYEDKCELHEFYDKDRRRKP